MPNLDSMDRRKLISRIVLFSPVILALIIMLPRLASPHFGLLDDATNIYATKQLENGDLSWVKGLNSGRFRPAYFLIFALIYSIAGMNPFIFFIVNAILLMGITAGLIFLVFRLTDNKTISWWSGTLFVLSSPVIESFYTVNKPEPLQIAWLMIAILLLMRYARLSTVRKKILVLSITSLLILFAILVKETAITFIPISIAWFVGASLYQWVRKKKRRQSIKLYCMISAITAGAMFILLWFVVKQSVMDVEGVHFRYSFELSKILQSIKAWERWIDRDFFFLYPLTITPLVWFIHKRDFPHASLFFDSLVWMIGWIAIFLPWVYQLDYYLLPFALGSSIVAALLLHQTISIGRRGGLIFRLAAIGSLSLAAIFFLATLPNNLTNARLQLTVDQHNANLVSYITEELPQNATLLINIQERSEYLGTTRSFVNLLYGRADIQLEQFNFQTIKPDDSANLYYYIATPIFRGQFYRSVRLGFSADASRRWEESITPYLDDSAVLVYETEGSFHLFLVEIRLGCLLRDVPGYCDIPTIPFDRRELTYGWKVYRIPFSE